MSPAAAGSSGPDFLTRRQAGIITVCAHGPLLLSKRLFQITGRLLLNFNLWESEFDFQVHFY